MVVILSSCNANEAERYCSNCGKAISKNDAFCYSCGAAVNQDLEKNIEVTANTNDKNDNNSSVTEQSSSPNITDNNSSINEKSNSSNITNNSPSKTKQTTSSNTHKHSYSKTVTAPTCTEKGYTKYTCSCGESYIDNYTEPAHKFVNYKCSVCSEMDVEHLTDCIKEWLRKNGSLSGSYYVYTWGLYEDPSGGNTYYALEYSANQDAIIFGYSVNTFDNIHTFISFTIPKSPTLNYDFANRLTNQYDEELAFCYGTINAKGFTKESPIACSTIGDKSITLSFEEITRKGVCNIIDEMSSFFSEQNLGYTIKDLGFNAF